jgi:glycogen operon protein
MSLNHLIREANKAWHGVTFGQPDWGDNSHAVAFGAELRKERLTTHLILNAYWEPLEFELPPAAPGRGPWRRWIDTSLPSPQDIVEWRAAPPVPGNTYRAGPRSVAMLHAGIG